MVIVMHGAAPPVSVIMCKNKNEGVVEENIDFDKFDEFAKIFGKAGGVVETAFDFHKRTEKINMKDLENENMVNMVAGNFVTGNRMKIRYYGFLYGFFIWIFIWLFYMDFYMAFLY